MNDNKGQTIFLSVIGIATLLVAIVGATFAWFSASVTGNEEASSIVVTTAKVASVTFADGSDTISQLQILPGWSKSKTFTISHPGTNTVAQLVDVYLTWSTSKATADATSDYADLVYTLTKSLKGEGDVYGEAVAVTQPAADLEDPTTEAINFKTAQTNKKSKLDSFTVAPNTPTDYQYTLSMTFTETYADQNTQQGAGFWGKVSVELDKGTGTMYYNNANPSGTDIEPVAPGA